jgi:hypothetical protein
VPSGTLRESRYSTRRKLSASAQGPTVTHRSPDMTTVVGSEGLHKSGAMLLTMGGCTSSLLSYSTGVAGPAEVDTWTDPRVSRVTHRSWVCGWEFTCT